MKFKNNKIEMEYRLHLMQIRNCPYDFLMCEICYGENNGCCLEEEISLLELVGSY